MNHIFIIITTVMMIPYETPMMTRICNLVRHSTRDKYIVLLVQSKVKTQGKKRNLLLHRKLELYQTLSGVFALPRSKITLETIIKSSMVITSSNGGNSIFLPILSNLA